LSEPIETPFRKAAPRSRWVYVTGARVGLSRGLGGQVIPDAEKFFAGGGTTIRGFEDDKLGGEDFFGPVGGNAVFLWNNELRFPIRGIFGGATFLDVGNVYSTVGEFSFGDLREAAGFGLRVRTPFFLLRADYGIKLDRRPGESRGQFFFSIGQAF
jgi:outer membrane protein insertion porin family